MCGDTIVHVGKSYGGTPDETIDGKASSSCRARRHTCAPAHRAGYKGLREEHGVPEMFMTGLYERNQAFNWTPMAGRRRGSRYSELLASA